jgi:transketolase
LAAPEASGAAKGAYVLAGTDEAKPDVILIGTGSEVQLCLGAYARSTVGSGWRLSASTAGWCLSCMMTR